MLVNFSTVIRSPCCVPIVTVTAYRSASCRILALSPAHRRIGTIPARPWYGSGARPSAYSLQSRNVSFTRKSARTHWIVASRRMKAISQSRPPNLLPAPPHPNRATPHNPARHPPKIYPLGADRPRTQSHTLATLPLAG